MKKSFLAAILAACVFAANGATPVVKVTEEGGFVDLELPVQNVEVLKDGTRNVVVRGNLDGKIVGFAVEFRANWQRKPIEGSEDAFYWGAGRLVSTGGDTDRFVEALGRLYGQAPGNRQAKASVEAEVVGLGSDPSQMPAAPTRMKFFFLGDGSEAQYSEVFIHTDLKRGVLLFNEKDLEYRTPLLNNLAK